MRALFLALVMLLIASAPAAAQDPRISDGTAQKELDDAKARWAAAGIRDYAFTFRAQCYCPSPQAEESVVRGGMAEKGRTVEQLFELVQREIDNKVDKLTV